MASFTHDSSYNIKSVLCLKKNEIFGMKFTLIISENVTSKENSLTHIRTVIQESV